MHAVLASFTPIWLLTAVGYLVGRAGLLGEHAEAVLGRFVFHVAMPAALFEILSGTSLRGFLNVSLLAFAAGTVLASLIGVAAARWLFGRRLAEQAIGGMAAGYVNSANLGIPVAVQVLGDASFVAPVLLLQTLVVTPVILATLDAGTADSPVPSQSGGRRGSSSAARLLLLPLRNPIIIASALGTLASATGWRLPGVLDHSCRLLGAAAVPAALVTLGLSLCSRPSAATHDGSRAEVGVAVVTKTLVQPLIAFLVGSLLLRLPPHQLLAVVVCSALPTAQNVFIYAREYGFATTLARDSVLVSTLLSMGTLSAIAWALG